MSLCWDGHLEEKSSSMRTRQWNGRRTMSVCVEVYMLSAHCFYRIKSTTDAHKVYFVFFCCFLLLCLLKYMRLQLHTSIVLVLQPFCYHHHKHIRWKLYEKLASYSWAKLTNPWRTRTKTTDETIFVRPLQITSTRNLCVWASVLEIIINPVDCYWKPIQCRNDVSRHTFIFNSLWFGCVCLCVFVCAEHQGNRIKPLMKGMCIEMLPWVRIEMTKEKLCRCIILVGKTRYSKIVKERTICLETVAKTSMHTILSKAKLARSSSLHTHIHTRSRAHTHKWRQETNHIMENYALSDEF